MTRWLILGLIVVAAVLRFYRLETSLQFLGDQGRDALVIKRLLIDHDLPFIGPITSVGGFYLGPLYYYLMAPFLWLWRLNPVGPAYATAAIGVITVPLLFLVTKKFFSGRTGLAASALFTMAAVAVQETRSAWNPNPMPLAALGILYGFYLANYRQKPAGLILAAASFAAALQFHYMIVFLSPWLIWQLLLAWRRLKLKKYFWLALATFFLMMSPLILFELKNHWLNLKGLLEFFGKKEYQQLNLLQLLKDINGRSEQAIGMVLGFGRQFNLVRTWVTRSLLLGLIILLVKKRSPQLIMVSLWLLSSIISLAVYQSNVYPHYLGFLFPIVFILTAEILIRLPRLLLPLVPIFLGLFASYNYPQLKQTLTYQGNLTRVKATVATIQADIQLNHYDRVNLALLDDTRDYRAMNYRYFLELNYPSLLDIDAYPQTQVLYAISPYPQPDLLQSPIWEIQALLPAQLVGEWQFPDRENIYKIKKL